ncbi:class I SAM-dependent methyltransferase [Shumkonia mesophila]|uniref:class I SAM-dependent methyltransferase n=1 Tax=Shumkonia mesophila TaxID=2838854 RepID=UPI002934A6BE|nr:class I SAM-dependent methyltransferase [Shumkonia mesophila]
MVNISTADRDVSKAVADYWDWRASSFGFADKNRTYWEAALSRAFPLGEELRVLDIGTGTGFLAAVAASWGHRVWGIDLSERMLDEARKNLAREGVAVELSLGDARNPDFQAGFFDVIVCRNVLWTLPDPPTALLAWKRILRESGRVIVSDGMWQPAGLARLGRVLIRRLGYFLPGGSEKMLCRFETKYRSIKRAMPFFRGLDVPAATRLLESTGFDQIERFDDGFPGSSYRVEASFFILGATKSASR